MAISPYRPQDGWLIRRLSFVLLVAYGAFSAFRAYVWAKVWRLGLPVIGNHVLNWGEVAGVAILLAWLIGVYYLIFLNRRTSDFLIEVEAELRKVAWPEHKPVGSPKAELWGSTYIVIGVVIVMTIFIGVVDYAFAFCSDMLFYGNP